ncbi:hypothetical protein VPH35_140825 [Triticum aestivum]
MFCICVPSWWSGAVDGNNMRTRRADGVVHVHYSAHQLGQRSFEGQGQGFYYFPTSGPGDIRTHTRCIFFYAKEMRREIRKRRIEFVAKNGASCPCHHHVSLLHGNNKMFVGCHPSYITRLFYS